MTSLAADQTTTLERRGLSRMLESLELYISKVIIHEQKLISPSRL